MPTIDFYPNYGGRSGGPRVWSSSSTSSTLWLTSDHDCFHCALHAALGLRHLESKPTIRRRGDGWQVRYQPKMVLINGAAS